MPVPDLIVAMAAVFGTVALISGVVIALVLEHRSPVRRRLSALWAPGAASSRVVLGARPLAAGADPALKRLATYIPKSPKEMTVLQRKLAAAGYHGFGPIVTYCVAEIALAALGVIVPLLVFGLRGFLVAVAGGLVGYVLPGIVVQRQVAKRRLQIQNGLPDALDLLIVCLEAGLGIDQAILKTADELSIAYPALGDELRMVNIETRAGKPRLEAFKNFSRRSQVDDVRALVAMLVQTDRFGTSVAQSLRTHAEVSRGKRKARAEERAAKLGVKLVFPLVFCLFPAFFVVAMGSAVVKLVHFFAEVQFPS
jgi:tight adherence protein C